MKPAVLVSSFTNFIYSVLDESLGFFVRFDP